MKAQQTGPGNADRQIVAVNLSAARELGRSPLQIFMSNSEHKYVAKAEAGVGWRIWKRRTKRRWGNYFFEYPEAVLQELNGLARQEVLVRLCKSSQPKARVVKSRRRK
jgi:hypothetical protein